MKRRFFTLAMMAIALPVLSQRVEKELEEGWRFHLGDVADGQAVGLNDSEWEVVRVPHDWAIGGSFDRRWDLQEVAVRQNGEHEATWKTGRTGGLPYIGAGWYRTTFDCPVGTRAELVFDGAMSQAQVFVNGERVCFWPYGYGAFHVEVTDAVAHGGWGLNTLAVRLENMEQSSRWYPGAGLYRSVRLITTGVTRVPVWGTHITTHLTEGGAEVHLSTELETGGEETLCVATEIVDGDGRVVASREDTVKVVERGVAEQCLSLENPRLWSPETPSLYEARSRVYYINGAEADSYTTRFGVREVGVSAEGGFRLNGERVKFRGVCLHHDLGPLGAATNRSALRHRLELLRDMGCNAVRTAHNPPAEELVELCDEMGLMVMLEAFDEWDVAKCKNGYHLFFKEWAERDLENMLLHYRNNPSVVMWSIGNEVPTQWRTDGHRTVEFLQGVCHRLDGTRPVTCGMDQVTAVLGNGFADALDVPGLNYRTGRYEEALAALRHGFVLGSETASTVSSRGVYAFPVVPARDAVREDHQCSGYDVECCSWSNLPEEDFALSDDFDWTLGQFVWTGFDYLGEPSPYDTDAWPNHSSMFGILDLAAIPKDRYYLYRSVWAPEKRTLHVVPHWTWPGREGEVTPVFVYTDADSAELFVNGRSRGVQRKLCWEECLALKGSDPLWLQRRYRLMWTDVAYEPGELRVVAYGAGGGVTGVATVRTAGEAVAVVLEAERDTLLADGCDVCHVTVSIVDGEGNLCPWASDLVRFSVSGEGVFRAAANGDPTCLDAFQLPEHHAFSGRLTAIVGVTDRPGDIVLEASAEGLLPARLTLRSQ